MKTAEQCLELLSLASNCPDVALTETIALIQRDAYNAAIEDASKTVLGGSFLSTESPDYKWAKSLSRAIIKLKKL